MSDYPDWQKNIRAAQAIVKRKEDGEAAVEKDAQDARDALQSKRVADFLELIGLPRGERFARGRRIDKYAFECMLREGVECFSVSRTDLPEGRFNYENRYYGYHWDKEKGQYQFDFDTDAEHFGAWIANALDLLDMRTAPEIDMQTEPKLKTPQQRVFDACAEIVRLVYEEGLI